MHALKEKVADKLSRFLADSPSPPSHFATESPVTTPTSEASLLSKQERYGSERSLSSFLLSFIPTASVDGYKTNKRRHDIKPIRSLPNRWRSKSFTWRDKPLDFIGEKEPEFQRKEAPETCKKVEEDYHALRNISCSNNCEEASTSHTTVNYFDNLSDKSSFISSDLYEFLQSTLPNIVKGCQWVLLYSTLKHGISLRTLLRKSADLPGPCLLIVGDMQGAVFGGLLDCPLKPTAKRKYQGTNQTFVFTTIYGQPRLFRATGANRYYYICLNDLLALGGGGNFALCLDGDLLRGTSGPCETFGNLCLANSPEFELKNVEVILNIISVEYLAVVGVLTFFEVP
ncbi:TLDc [Macleaya cordata]|uniref:TLDc n=1 Tax=Macleaya cordata TaxID=56857 RepID=A0A200PVT9_MACCD|nr:TLDc [Macleaya cordata]